MPHTQRIETILERHNLFALLPPSVRTALVKQTPTETYPAGTMLFQQDDIPSHCLLLLSGEVRIHLIAPSGKEILMATMGEGELLGEMALLDDGPRSATATTLTPVTALKISRAAFQQALNASPASIWSVIHVLCQRVRETNEQLMMISLQDLPTRLASYLVKRATLSGTQQKDGIILDLGLSQGDLATLLAASREKVNKQLRAWQAQGLIKILPDKKLCLRDLAGLKKRTDTSLS